MSDSNLQYPMLSPISNNEEKSPASPEIQSCNMSKLSVQVTVANVNEKANLYVKTITTSQLIKTKVTFKICTCRRSLKMGKTSKLKSSRPLLLQPKVTLLNGAGRQSSKVIKTSKLKTSRLILRKPKVKFKNSICRRHLKVRKTTKLNISHLLLLRPKVKIKTKPFRLSSKGIKTSKLKSSRLPLHQTKVKLKNGTCKRFSKVRKRCKLRSSRLLTDSKIVSSFNVTCSKSPSLKTSTPSLEARQSSEKPQNKFKIEPELFGYQMVGDSQFCRFGEQLLGLKRELKRHSCGSIGICVSGQTISDLHKRVKEKFYPISEKIILMIGTNDFLRNKDVTTICQELSDLVRTLQETVGNIILLTLPPIPRLERRNSIEHFTMLDKYNHYIHKLKDGDRIKIADISPRYVIPSPLQSKKNLFEKYYKSSPPRYDMVHLNRQGLEVMRKCLLENFS